ncbi:MAG: hypothetical protein K2Q19_13315 [Rhodocyclaceae bacterium]|nr:hypothetical protein [Rhodocyclaceae bacterium]
MSVLSVSLASPLATVGFSAANTRQLAAVRDSIDNTVGSSRQRTPESDDAKTAARRDKQAAETELSPQEQRRIAELKRIDAAVRAHEQAHIAVGRELITSGPNYQYTYGPDGKRYAVGGEVGIDTSPEREPEANIDKGQRIQDTALAPVDPSPQDYRVAATGKQLEDQGRRDLRAERAAEAAPRDSRVDAYASPRERTPQLDVYV